MPIVTNLWTEEELALLRRRYAEAEGSRSVDLNGLEQELGRARSNICRKARELGLTDRHRRATADQNRATSERQKAWYQTHEHPRGMQGKHHTRYRRDVRSCLLCGSLFTTIPASTKRYCSTRCAYDDRRGQPYPVKTCEHCGKQWQSDWRSIARRFCSRACSGAAHRKTITKTCIRCGTPFTLPAKLSHSRTCCSRACGKVVRDEASSRVWRDPAFRQRMGDITSRRHRMEPAASPRYSNRKGGYREDLGLYVRSRWEANIARYLNWLKANGEIFNWAYEEDTFWFEKIRRGVRSYRPDFKIWDTEGGEPYYWEVKGYDYPRGKTARKRMAIYYPKVKLVVIDEPGYKAIAKWRALIPDWE